MQQFQRHANLGCGAEEARERGWNQLGWDKEHEPVGQRNQAIFYDDPGFAVGIVGRNELVAEAEFAAELSACGLFAEEGVWTALENDAVHVFRSKRSTEAL